MSSSRPSTTAATSLSLVLVLVLHAFAGGCTAMTGVEAIANGVLAFKPSESRNAAAALSPLAITLGVLFLGITYLGHRVGAVPTEQANVIAQVGRTVADGPLFCLVQLSAAVVLLLAANTSFNGFPLLAATMARAGFFPHQFTTRGQRHHRLAEDHGHARVAPRTPRA